MSVWLPRLASDVIRRKDRRNGGLHDRRPVVFVEVVHQKQVVFACCREAARAGVCPGMALSQARVVVRNPRVEPHRADRDAASLRGLAAWSSRFSPLVAVDRDGLLMDVSGCALVFGGEERLFAFAKEQYAALGFEARMAIAPTFGCAWGMARFGTPGIVREGEAKRALLGLPLAALRITNAAVQSLQEVGIDRIGQVMELPRSLLPSRFGDELLFRLDQAIGHALELIEPVRVAAPPAVSQVFDGPTTQWEAIEACTRMLIERLASILKERESGARRIDILLERSDLPPALLTLTLSRPTRDVRHLWSLVRPRLERVNLGHEGGGVDEIRIGASFVKPLPHEQFESWNDRRSDHEQEVASLLDTLRNRLGTDRVCRVEIRESHLPERATVLRCGLEDEPSRAAMLGKINRPTLLFSNAASAEVVSLAPDGPVISLRWRSGESRITATEGPENLGAEWWRKREPSRSYFKVQDERGRWLWLYRESETSKWFVHGVWA